MEPEVYHFEKHGRLIRAVQGIHPQGHFTARCPSGILCRIISFNAILERSMGYLKYLNENANAHLHNYPGAKT